MQLDTGKHKNNYRILSRTKNGNIKYCNSIIFDMLVPHIIPHTFKIVHVWNYVVNISTRFHAAVVFSSREKGTSSQEAAMSRACSRN
jgi:hypothetical protein